MNVPDKDDICAKIEALGGLVINQFDLETVSPMHSLSESSYLIFSKPYGFTHVV